MIVRSDVSPPNLDYCLVFKNVSFIELMFDPVSFDQQKITLTGYLELIVGKFFGYLSVHSGPSLASKRAYERCRD